MNECRRIPQCGHQRLGYMKSDNLSQPTMLRTLHTITLALLMASSAAHAAEHFCASPPPTRSTRPLALRPRAAVA